MKNITVLGTGVLGAQIIYQIAVHGYSVTAYDINADALEAAKTRLKKVSKAYQKDMDATEETVTKGLDNIFYSSDLADAVKDADLMIEAVPEILDLKQKIYEKLAKVAPAKTIFATNSSTLLPSDMMDFTGRPEKFLAMHFANTIWLHNIIEVEKTDKTSQETYDTVIDFVKSIDMIPIEIKKETPGYLLNSLLVPFLANAAVLFNNGVADPETIDKTWTVGTGAPKGPFRILDTIGLGTAYNIFAASTDPEVRKFAEVLKRDYIDKGKMGEASGEGFYKYNK